MAGPTPSGSWSALPTPLRNRIRLCSHQTQIQGPVPGQHGGPSGPQVPAPPPPAVLQAPRPSPLTWVKPAQEESSLLTSFPQQRGGRVGPRSECRVAVLRPRLVGVLGGRSELSCRIQHHYRPPAPIPSPTAASLSPQGPLPAATRLATWDLRAVPQGDRSWTLGAGWPRRGLQAGRMGWARGQMASRDWGPRCTHTRPLEQPVAWPHHAVLWVKAPHTEVGRTPKPAPPPSGTFCQLWVN